VDTPQDIYRSNSFAGSGANKISTNIYNGLGSEALLVKDNKGIISAQ